MKLRFLVMACMVGFACADMSALAQTSQQRPRPPASAPATPPPEVERPLIYEPQLLQLAEALGVIAYMSQLCAGPEAEDWRRSAQAIIDAEGLTSARKERLAGAYNRGFAGHQAMHRNCTDTARLILDRRRAEARRVTQDIATRFGG